MIDLIQVRAISNTLARMETILLRIEAKLEPTEREVNECNS